MVNCGDFSGDCRVIHSMILYFRCLEDGKVLFEMISDTIMSMEVILFK